MTTHETSGKGWPVNDIGGLAREVPEVDPRRYFDEQARLAYEEALVKWPVLARLMGLVDDDARERPIGDGSDDAGAGGVLTHSVTSR